MKYLPQVTSLKFIPTSQRSLKVLSTKAYLEKTIVIRPSDKPFMNNAVSAIEFVIKQKLHKVTTNGQNTEHYEMRS